MTQFLGFTVEQTSRVTGLSIGQLRYWDKTGFFTPEASVERRIYARIYSFRNLVGLRTIAILRNAHKVPLQELRKVGQWLKDRHDSPWSSLRLFVAGRRVFFEDPSTGAIVATRSPNQSVLPIELV